MGKYTGNLCALFLYEINELLNGVFVLSQMFFHSKEKRFHGKFINLFKSKILMHISADQTCNNHRFQIYRTLKQLRFVRISFFWRTLNKSNNQCCDSKRLKTHSSSHLLEKTIGNKTNNLYESKLWHLDQEL